MKVAVMGAGSVGCYFGALLARAGNTVTLIGRAPHVEAVREGGLRLETSAGSTLVRLAATTGADGVAGAEVVLVCVKSGDTEAAGRAIRPHLHAEAAVLSLQNGVDNAERLAAVLERPVVPVAVYVATEMAGPGHVRHHGRGELVLGASPASERLAAMFAAAGIPAEVSARAVDALWGKLIVNCAYNALSALTRMPYGRMLTVPGMADAMRDIVAECIAVARASGIAVPDDTPETVLALAGSMPNQSSSTAQDLARGRETEIDHLNGLVVAKGKVLGIPTPANGLLCALIKAAEADLPPR